MSLKQDSYLIEEKNFIQPETPQSNGRRALIALCWLAYSVIMVVSVYYVHIGWAVKVHPAPATSNYRLSDQHYIYKKQPLPLPEESTEDVSKEESNKEEGDLEQQPVTEEPVESTDLKARVKQAMAELDQQ